MYFCFFVTLKKKIEKHLDLQQAAHLSVAPILAVLMQGYMT